ncbi:hypothetical protein TL16_g12674, partial [Triparma laevis f. inornata]
QSPLHYTHVKCIPGSTIPLSGLVSGLCFRKLPVTKSMVQTLKKPRIMLLGSGVEFDSLRKRVATNAASRISSIDTLLEAEEKYMSLRVKRILSYKPDILCTASSIGCIAKRLLEKEGVTCISNVRVRVLERIGVKTGAVVVASLESGVESGVVGVCRRARFVTVRDEKECEDGRTYLDWRDMKDEEIYEKRGEDTGHTSKTNLPSKARRERVKALAGARTGCKVVDGSKAVEEGTLMRGVTKGYCLLEGCPKERGSTVILRGENKETLKQVKRVLQLCIVAAYNLRLESAYLYNRCSTLPSPLNTTLLTSSLGVDYGRQPFGVSKNVRPWCGSHGTYSKHCPKGCPVSAFDHQGILVTSMWLASEQNSTQMTQCSASEVKGISYYTDQDVTLGQFLRDSCFNMSLKCQNPTCKKNVLEHTLSFVHKDGQININVEMMDARLPTESEYRAAMGEPQEEVQENSLRDDDGIAMWSYCTRCAKVVTPLCFMDDDTWRFSFGKFLEVSFYNKVATINGLNDTDTADNNKPCCGHNMQSDMILYFGCKKLAARFTYQPIRPYNVYVRRHLTFDAEFHRQESHRELQEAANLQMILFNKFSKKVESMSSDVRGLFSNAVNKQEHLQAVLGELTKIGEELKHTRADMDMKTKTIFDLHRHYSGQLAKFATLENPRKASNVSGLAGLGDLPNGGTSSAFVKKRMSPEDVLRFPLHSRRYMFLLLSAWNERLSVAGSAVVAMKKLAGPSGSTATNPTEDPTEDVVERVRRLMESSSSVSSEFDAASLSHVPKTSSAPANIQRRKSKSDRADSDIKNKKVTDKAGAMKSAINRLFNRGNKEFDPHVVDLSELARGRPRLDPGIRGDVVLVFEDQPSTIIAYSLSSKDYHDQFKQFVDYNEEGREVRGGSTFTRPSMGSEMRGGMGGVDGGGGGEVNGESPRINRTKSLEGVNFPGKQGQGQEQGMEENVNAPAPMSAAEERKELERRMMLRGKTHIKHHFRDVDDKGQTLCKYVCTTYWATQFQAVRKVFLSNGEKRQASGGEGDEYRHLDDDASYVKSLATSFFWAANGGKSGASFAKTADGRFVVKCISRTEVRHCEERSDELRMR